MTAAGPSPFRRPIAVADIPRAGLDIRVEANAQQRAEVARHFDLLGIEALSGSYHVSADSPGARVRGEVTASVRQTCVVSLEPFRGRKYESRSISPSRRGPREDAHGSRSIFPPMTKTRRSFDLDGKIDLGAVTLEFLALGLDPHPRKPGVELLPSEEPKRKSRLSPFAVLARHPGKAPSKE